MSPADPERATHPPRQGALQSILSAVVVVAAVLLALVLAQAAIQGRVGLEKILTDLALPYGVLWTGVTLAAACSVALWRRGLVGRWPLALSLVLWLAVTLLGNRTLSEWAWSVTQYPVAAAAPSEGAFELVIVLGGGIGSDPLDRPQLSDDGDRIRPALQLWYAGRAKKIAVTGTAATSGERRGPADLTEELLISFGVPAEAILRVEGRNTSEEMVALRQVVESLAKTANADAQRAEPPRIGLVTSAFHMPRALRLAHREGLQQQGVELVPLPTAYRGVAQPIGWPRRVVPTVDAMSDLSKCWKERLARLVGR